MGGKVARPRRKPRPNPTAIRYARSPSPARRPQTAGYMDLYHRGAFVLKAKKLRQSEGHAFDDAMLRARGQAEQCARARSAAQGRPPFLPLTWLRNHRF